MRTAPDRQRGGHRLVTAALVLVGLIGVVLVMIALITQVGDPPQAPLAGATSSAASDAGGSESSDATTPASDAGRSEPADSSTAAPTASPTADSSTAATSEAGAPPLPRSEPTRISIPSLGVDAPVFAIGIAADGTLPAPDGTRADNGETAWYDQSPTPGEAGPAIIEGHVTWHDDRSVFFELGGIGAGATIDVERADGTTATFEVYDVARYPKKQFPTLAVYGRTNGPELRLITCGGDLDADGHHLDNTIVSARLVAS